MTSSHTETSATTTAQSSPTQMISNNYSLVLDPFMFKLFHRLPLGDMATFTSKVNSFLNDKIQQSQSSSLDDALTPGYAPFCKHLFIPNFTQAPSPTVPITPENSSLIHCGYEKRRENELAVLARWIDLEDILTEKSSQLPAKYLDIILYSREQVFLEHDALESISEYPAPEGLPLTTNCKNFEYGIISIKPQDLPNELPMNPITMMRNALGVDQGGSGVDLDPEKYDASVKFWENNVLLKYPEKA